MLKEISKPKNWATDYTDLTDCTDKGIGRVGSYPCYPFYPCNPWLKKMSVFHGGIFAFVYEIAVLFYGYYG